MPHRPHHHLGGLPLHLSLAMLQWMSLQKGSMNWIDAWQSLKQPSWEWPAGFQNPMTSHLSDLLRNPALEDALRHEAQERMISLLEGIQKYQNFNYRRTIEEPQILTSKDRVRLLFYPAETRKAKAQVFLIPSLINRYYILDLNKRLSFARHLTAQGFHVYIIDWADPLPEQRDFNSETYLLEYVLPFLEVARKHSKLPIALAGYCMGGLLALAVAVLRPKWISSLALLATPWDFHTPEFPRVALDAPQAESLRQWFRGADLIPADYVQMLFYASNPWVFHHKFQHFSTVPQNSQSAEDFVAIEQWVNDGVAITSALAEECLIDWTQSNITRKNQWQLEGKIIDPSIIRKPTFIAVPKDDRIVPTSSALPLATLIKESVLVEPDSGHVSMIVGSRRKAGLWNPYTEWLQRSMES